MFSPFAPAQSPNDRRRFFKTRSHPGYAGLRGPGKRRAAEQEFRTDLHPPTRRLERTGSEQGFFISRVALVPHAKAVAYDLGQWL